MQDFVYFLSFLFFPLLLIF